MNVSAASSSEHQQQQQQQQPSNTKQNKKKHQQQLSSSTSKKSQGTIGGDGRDHTDVITQHHQPTSASSASSSVAHSPRKLSPKSSLQSHSVSFMEPLNRTTISSRNPRLQQTSSLVNMPNLLVEKTSPSSSESATPTAAPTPSDASIILAQAKKETRPHMLGTINEKSITEDDSPVKSNPTTTVETMATETVATTAPNIGRTNSSGSIPDYLSHKLHSQMNLASNLWKSKRKSIAVSAIRDSKPPPMVRLVKESCDSSTSTTTSESYHLNDLPALPAKLASLSKPPVNTFFLNSSFRRARHSIDVRALPSYLAKKRQSTFGQLLSVISPTAPEESSSSDDPLFAEPIAPTLSLGERVAWIRSSGPEFGVVKWIGRMPQISANDWTVGIEFDNAIGSGDGTVDGRRYFVAKENFAKFLPISELTKVDNYAGRPRSGTMLSRMSVQLKPGQLISIQRSPTTAVPHCYLNAPHHVGHDVHSPNNRHCQCHSCNHPCAHICKTRKPKGKRWTEDMAHMCHFSSKPHAMMCCGGEDLATASEPLKEPGVSWKHIEVIQSLRTVPTEIVHQRKNTLHSLHMHMNSSKEPIDSMKRFSRHFHSRQPTTNESSPNYNPSEQTGSGILERTGSDLSISSLPSSSSVAEMYIGRSVLTDESDIDSETERSLETNSKVEGTNKQQGLRSLVACFLANSLRLKSIKPSSDSKKNKADHSHVRRRKYNENRRPESNHHKKLRSKTRVQPNQKLGLSSTDTSYNADIPSSVPNTQPFNSLSSDTSHHQPMTEINPTQSSSTAFSPRYNSNAIYTKANFYGTKSSPYRTNETMQQHHIDGHISEEITNSTSSSTHKHTRAGSSDKRTSNYTSSENFQSPRRRRNKGPAPKPPKLNNQNSQQTGYSSSPVSNADPVSTSLNSFAQSLSNTSLTTSCSSKHKTPVIATKSPIQQPPHLVRSLSEQKQLNMKILINALPSFRSEVNLQEIIDDNKNDEELVIQLKPQQQNNAKDEINSVHKNENSQKRIDDNLIESIYEMPLSGKGLLQKDLIPPDLPAKTFDPIKVFGCNVNLETKLLESRTGKNVGPASNKDNNIDSKTNEAHQSRIHPQPNSPSITRSKSMPFAKYTCCIYHWREYLASINEKNVHLGSYFHHQHPDQQQETCQQRDFCDVLLDDSVCDCKNDNPSTGIISNLTNALLSPKHSIRFKKSDFDLKISSPNEKNIIIINETLGQDNLLEEMTSFEYVRAMSDGSLTNTTSAATVVEFINDDQGVDGSTKSQDDKNMAQNVKDVFCQTNFKESPEKSSSRRCKHKHCRCRNLRYRNHRKDCRHQFACTLHNECCLTSSNLQPYQEKKCSNVWLTSSTSDHSLSSLSSSNSTLSETSAMRTSNDVINFKNQPINFWSSTKFNKPSCLVDSFKTRDPNEEDGSRSNISTEKLFKSANQPMFPINHHTKPDFITFDKNPLQPGHSYSSVTSKKSMGFATENFALPLFDDGPNEFCNKNDYAWSRCLMSQLELAIANGDHQRAAILAKELAFKKVNCSLTGKFTSGQGDIISCDSPIVTYLYIEDRVSHRGPIPFQLYSSMTVDMLKIKVEKEFNIPGELQQWFFGKNLALNMDASLYSYGITSSGCPIFLCIKSSNDNDGGGGGGVGCGVGNNVEDYTNSNSSNKNRKKNSTLRRNNNNNNKNENIPKTNGDIFEKNVVASENQNRDNNEDVDDDDDDDDNDEDDDDDDNIFECLQPSSLHLPPYSSSLESNKNNNEKKETHVSLVISSTDNRQINNNTSNNANISYIQNPLASLDLDALNNISSSRTSFNETTTTLIATTSNNVGQQQQSQDNNFSNNKNYFHTETDIPYDQNELVFESLNFINEMLPRVEEENEDDLEEYYQGGNDDDGTNENIGITSGDSIKITKYNNSNQMENVQLVDVDELKNCIINTEPFQCPICSNQYKCGDGVVLRECSHTFCRGCLKNTIEFSEQVQIKCPSCDSVLEDGEIKELTTSEIYERYLSRSISAVEKILDKSLLKKSIECPVKR